jgi:hypothetical protein
MREPLATATLFSLVSGSDRMIVRAALHIVGKNRVFLFALKDVEAGD